VLAAATAVVALAALYSLTAPWLSARRLDAASRALDRGDVSAALSAARDGHELNPFSLDGYLALADAEIVAGDQTAAMRQFRRGVDRQPENASAWYYLGQYEFSLKRYQAAYRDLNQAYTLDPWGPAGREGDLLDQARAKVNAGAK
jgi:tetratricopeptide (TPR) repeat protein